MSAKSNSIQSESNSGSPSQGGPEFLVVGKLRRPHGLRGDMLMTVLTDFPERLQPGFELLAGDAYLPLTIKSARWHGQDMLISFSGYTDREQVGIFRNQTVSVHADQIQELEDGEYYFHELVGLRVINAENEEFLGTVEKMIETGASHDVFLVITEDGNELVLPDIESVVMDIDINAQELRVMLIDGLLPDS